MRRIGPIVGLLGGLLLTGSVRAQAPTDGDAEPPESSVEPAERSAEPAERSAEPAESGPCPSSVVDLTDTLAQTEQAFINMDEAAFDKGRVEVDTLLACLNAPLTPRVAAALHRHAALAAFSELDPDSAVSSLQALLQIQPYFRFAPPLAPTDDHPLNQLVDQASEASLGTPLTVEMPRGDQNQIMIKTAIIIRILIILI